LDGWAFKNAAIAGLVTFGNPASLAGVSKVFLINRMECLMRRLLVIGCVFLVGLGSAQAQPPPPMPYGPVPPLRHEPIPPPPPGRVVWQPGHWQWSGRQYVWVGGRSVEQRPHYRRWVEGRWVWQPYQHRYVWSPAHWS
jgi:hypothetical protein